MNNLPNIALGQIEVKPGSPDENVALIKEYIDEARNQGAEIIAFPEMCVSGYILGDLWEIDSTVEDFILWGERIREYSQNITVIFGNVAFDDYRLGQDGRRRKYNAAYVCKDGEWIIRDEVPQGLPSGIQPKTLHPNYRMFDDDRHFFSVRQLAESMGKITEDWIYPYRIHLKDGTPFSFGVQLCEDMWCLDYKHRGRTIDTLDIYNRRNSDCVFNLSASPYTWMKSDKRTRVVKEILRYSPLPFFYVNITGSQNNGKNIVVFDGDSTIYSPKGDIVCRAESWMPELLLSKKEEVANPMTEVECHYDGIITGLQHLDHISGKKNDYLLGVSGGIDSSVVACLLTDAFGPERVFAINMPTKFNSQATQDNAEQLCKNLGIAYNWCPIKRIHETLAETIETTSFNNNSGDYTSLVDENLQARIRGADILAGVANKFGMLFTSNSNKTESALGYATLYGDINGAIAPIGDLYKPQIINLARHLNDFYGNDVIPINLLDGTIPASAELSAEQDVTQGKGDPIHYGYHDLLLRQMIEYRHSLADFFEWYLEGTFLEKIGWNFPKEFVRIFPNPSDWLEDIEWIDLRLRTCYAKRLQAPPVIILSKRSFGFDLRETLLPPYKTNKYLELRKKILND